jgi:hypothetical protein
LNGIKRVLNILLVDHAIKTGNFLIIIKFQFINSYVLKFGEGNVPNVYKTLKHEDIVNGVAWNPFNK